MRALLACALCAPLGAAQDEPLAWFTDAGETPERPIGVVRSRMVELDAGRLATDDALVLRLPDGLEVLVTRDAARSQRAGSRTWLGEVAGSPHGDVRLVRRGNAVAGTVRAEGRLYRLRPDGTGRHLVELVDETLLPGCAGDPSASEALDGAGGAGTGESGEAAGDAAGPTIDMLVVYTPSARNAAGGTDGVLALIDLAVLETNDAFERSGIDARVRLAHAAEATGYAESGGFGTTLTRLRVPGDGYLDEVHALRDLYGADQVTLIVSDTSSCGIAYVQDTPAGWFDQLAFSVVSRNCATGYYSFAHELGHNLGCHHDRANAGSGAFDFSYGHRSATGAWRTIMSYAPGTRVRNFSSPSVMYAGEATGISAGHPDSADNAKTIRTLAAAMAGYREEPITRYGESQPTSIGARASIAWSGSASVAAQNLALRLEDAVPGQGGVLHVGVTAAETPFRGATLLASLPLMRVAAFRVAGDGTTAITVPLAAEDVGATRHYQFLFRDPALVGGVATSDGLRVRVLP